jgi:O-acetyl-ADP-ribose deacetylase (regulator of RNase III)
MLSALIDAAVSAVVGEAALSPRLRAFLQQAPTRRVALGDVLIANDTPVSAATCQAVEALLLAERAPPVELAVMLADCPLHTVAGTRLVVWQGDIATLPVDAIVNAANDAGLGCFQPAHKCIDNVIHRRAGPALRESCRAALAQRPAELRVLAAGTTPLLTPGHALPARHVLHVTGPQLAPGRGVRPTATQVEQLTACYTGCLDVALGAGLRSVAFCCISTGLFNFPQEDAAQVAVRTARAWCLAHPSALDTIVFDVFLDADRDLYAAAVAVLLQ